MFFITFAGLIHACSIVERFLVREHFEDLYDKTWNICEHFRIYYVGISKRCHERSLPDLATAPTRHHVRTLHATICSVLVRAMNLQIRGSMKVPSFLISQQQKLVVENNLILSLDYIAPKRISYTSLHSNFVLYVYSW